MSDTNQSEPPGQVQRLVRPAYLEVLARDLYTAKEELSRASKGDAYIPMTWDELYDTGREACRVATLAILAEAPAMLSRNLTSQVEALRRKSPYIPDPVV